MILRIIVTVFATAILAACVSKEHPPWYDVPDAYEVPETLQRFSLERTACFGFCPIYKVTVDENDVLQFTGERFVAEAGGAVSKRLPKGSFKKLVSIAKAHDFAGYDSQYPDEDAANCAGVATDMPTVIIGFAADGLDHQVSVYQGCMNFAGQERFNEMLLAMDALLDIDDWIGPRDQFYGEGK